MSSTSQPDVATGISPGRTAVTFDEFYAGELPRLIALARGLCPSSQAEDVAQEAMLVACRRWREVSALERPDLWVRRTCANLATSQFRRRLTELKTTALLGSRRPAPTEMTPVSEEFWNAVRALPRRQAQAAALRFVYDMPLAEIAKALECSEGAVKQHLSRARHSLAATLSLGEEEG
jgi:RNA polymerase sigma factor (sigma-70 family)